MCFLDDEATSSDVEVMRATGDWVKVQNSHLYYLGRKDRLVKRHGQLVHLDALQQVGPMPFFFMLLSWVIMRTYQCNLTICG